MSELLIVAHITKGGLNECILEKEHHYHSPYFLSFKSIYIYFLVFLNFFLIFASNKLVKERLKFK